MPWVILGLVLVGLLASAPLAWGGEAAALGQLLFEQQCAMCHSTEKGVNQIGPSLAGVVGSKAAAVPGFAFSSALKESGIVWTPSALNKWLQNPHADVHGTTMAFPGIPDAKKRQDVVDYLATLK